MKKFMLSVITVIFTLFGLVGCSSPANEEKTETNQSEPTKDNSLTDDTSQEQNSTPENNNSNSNTDTDSTDDQNSDEIDHSEKDEVTQSKMSRLYYYDIEKDQIFYIDESVDVVDGAYINALTKGLKNNQNNEDFVTMNEETFVTSAKLDEEAGVLNIYFNDSFYLSTNLGSGIEVGFINALVNTYGYNYNVDKVAIYVENKLYEDQRGTMPNGYFPVTAESATKYE